MTETPVQEMRRAEPTGGTIEPPRVLVVDDGITMRLF